MSQAHSAENSKKSAELADRLTKIQAKFSRSKREFADSIGLSYDHVSRAILGTQAPSVPLLQAVCRVYKVSPAWLLLGRGEMLEAETRTVPAAAPDAKWLLIIADQAEQIRELRAKSTAPSLEPITREDFKREAEALMRRRIEGLSPPDAQPTAGSRKR